MDVYTKYHKTYSENHQRSIYLVEVAKILYTSWGYTEPLCIQLLQDSIALDVWTEIARVSLTDYPSAFTAM